MREHLVADVQLLLLGKNFIELVLLLQHVVAQVFVSRLLVNHEAMDFLRGCPVLDLVTLDLN